MKRLQIGLISLFLLLFGSGCATSKTATPQYQVPIVPTYMLKPLPAPVREINHNRDLLQLLADYEAMRLRFNADRIGTATILRHAEQFSW